MSPIRAQVRRLLRRAIGYDKLAKRLRRIEARLDRQNERLNRQNERLNRQRERLDAIKPTMRRATTLLEVLAAQNAAIEERLQDLSDKVERRNYDATDDERAEARNLLDEVREEHRRIRVRFGVVTRYEERVRRLEAALAEEMDAAAQESTEESPSG
jgi:predicted  nucleic acid-binding Zn-ribbon protein